MKASPVTFLIISSVLILLLSGELLAQENLPRLLDEGVKNYPRIRAKLAESESARRDVSAAKLEYLPRITAQHQYTYATSNSLAGSFYPNPAVISPAGSIRAENISQATWGSYTSALLEWNVFNFGKVSENIKAYKKLGDAAGANYENELLQHKTRIADIYLLALMYRKLTQIQSTNLQRAEAFAEAVNARVVAGMRAGADSSLASAEYAKAKILLLQAEREEQTHALRLQELVGRNGDDVMVVDSMTFLTAVPERLDTGVWNQQSNPLLRYYRLRSEASLARSISVKRSFLPSITLVGAAWARGSGISADDTYHTDFSSGTKYQVNNYLLGISTRWTISDFVGTRQRYKSEYYKTVRDQELFNEQDLRTKRQLTESELQYRISLEQAKAAPVQLLAARDAYRQASARYESGLTDLLTLMQSIVTLNRAEADMAIAYMNVWRSLLAIAAARGDFSIFIAAMGR
ncbi:MAG TPA: TolC family protein [Cyclobacteriaceae bacterium]|nr:TolC family protein [Cyclobacteriaceae bacterium]